MHPIRVQKKLSDYFAQTFFCSLNIINNFNKNGRMLESDSYASSRLLGFTPEAHRESTRYPRRIHSFQVMDLYPRSEGQAVKPRL